MIAVIEGLNGTGKSTIAKSISETMRIPILRPFRGTHRHFAGYCDGTAHELIHLGENGDATVRELRNIGVPANTYVDDIYAADFLCMTNLGCVLDRSMPSAIAYGQLYGDLDESKVDAKELLRIWQSILTEASSAVVVVNVVASFDVRQARCRGDVRWHPSAKQDKMLKQLFSLVFKHITLPKITVDTSEIPLADVGTVTLRRILDTLKK